MMINESLFHLAYVSRRDDSLSDDEIVDRIVLPAMLKNRRLNISGCIWFDEVFFFQVIEGEKKDILSLYKEIEKDSRHHSLVVLIAQPLDKRDFERFSMRLIADGTPAAVRQLISMYESDDCAKAGRVEIEHGEMRRMISTISAEFV